VLDLIEECPTFDSTSVNIYFLA